VVVNRSQRRLDNLRKKVDELKTDIAFEYICSADPARNDAILAQMAPASVVINSTGMGKDTPGSPISDAGVFPERGIAWDFNYRGELDFMHQALAQRERRRLVVEDGWLYFIHGWTQVIAQVFHVEIGDALLESLAEMAGVARPPKDPGLRR
jgi:shikimate 5-dehydrogenase